MFVGVAEPVRKNKTTLKMCGLKDGYVIKESLGE